jgi:predicted protein tyrosine phosphatase
MMSRLRILFICSRNRWRSPTAEGVYRNDPRVEVRSAGVSSAARRQVSERDLEWADLILVMEHGHARQIRERFRELDLPNLQSLDIPDEYQFGDGELVKLIRAGTEPFLTGQG